MKAGTKLLRWPMALLLCAVAGFGWYAVAQSDKASTRGPYEHVINLKAVIKFDGERIEIDNLLDCQTPYAGPPERAVQLGFNITPSPIAIETKDGGMIMISIPPNVCALHSKLWAGVDNGVTLSEAWIPLISWYDNRDTTKIVHGVSYLSETALEDPNGRLKIVEGFEIEYTEQAEELHVEAAKQAETYGIWLHDPPILQVQGPGIDVLPVYLKIPRSEWSKPPIYVLTPDRRSDLAGLRGVLDAMPQSKGLMYINQKSVISRAMWNTISDLVMSRRAWLERDGLSHGIPQLEEERWGLFLSQKSWERAQTERHLITFADDIVPMQLQDGVLTLRTDTPGLWYRDQRWSDWYSNTDRKIDFLGKPILNGPFELPKSYLIFDLETRDLWVSF